MDRVLPERLDGVLMFLEKRKVISIIVLGMKVL